MKMKMREIPIKLNTDILTKVKVKSRNYIYITDWDQNHLRGGTIRLGTVYVGDDAHDEILGTVFQWKN